MTSFLDNALLIKDDGDPTKEAEFQASGISTGTRRTYEFPNQSGKFDIISGIDVRNHGATGDGVTDDSAAILAALNATPAGSVLYFPKGTYKLSTWSVQTRATQIWIRGDGMQSTVIQGTASASFLNFSASCRISDLTLDTWSKAIDFSAVATTIERVLIEQVEILNYSKGIYGSNSTGGAGVRNFTVEGCKLTTGTSTAIYLDLPIIEKVQVVRNHIKTCVSRGIDLGANSLVFADDRGEYVIDGNIVDGVSNVGASAIAVICYGWRAVIVNNVVKNVTRDSPTASDCDGIYTKCRYTVVANNVLVDAGQAEAFINIKGGARDETVSQPYGYSVVVAGNMLLDTQTNPTLAGGSRQTNGIKVATSEVLVTNNYLEGLTETGIYTDSDSEASHPNHNIVISDNVIKNHRGSVAINVFGRGNLVRVMNNLIDTVANSFDGTGQNFGIDINKKEGSGIDIVGNRIKSILDTGTTPVGIQISPGALSKTVASVTPATDVVVTTAIHTFSVNDPVKFSTTGVAPAGITAGTTYYIKTIPSTTSFTLSATPGGATLDITDAGSGTHTVTKVVTLSDWRIADNHVTTATRGLQFSWDQTYVSVDTVLVRHNTFVSCTSDITYTDTPTNLVSLLAQAETIARVDANTAELVNGTNPQALNIYGTDDGAGNTEYVALRMDTTHGTIDVVATGTGTLRTLEIRLNNVAVWKWSTSGHFQPATNNAVDIGSASLRTRDVYVGGDLLLNNASSRLYLDYTNTATVGNVTINKVSGRVNMAAGATAVVVTNNRVTAASHVIAVAAANDATGSVKNVVAAAGSFTINSPAACTANMAIDFVVLNAD